MGLVGDMADNWTDLVILDAQDFEGHRWLASTSRTASAGLPLQLDPE